MNTTNFCPGTSSSDSIQLQASDCLDTKLVSTPHNTSSQQLDELASEGDYSDSEYMPNIAYYPGGNDSEIGASSGGLGDIEDYDDEDADDDEYLHRPIKEEYNMTAATQSRLLDPSTYPHSHQTGPPKAYSNYSTEASFRPPSLSMLHYTYNYPTRGRSGAMGPPSRFHGGEPTGYPPNFWYPNSSSEFYTPPPPSAPQTPSHLSGHHMEHYPPPPGHYGRYPHHPMHHHHPHHHMHPGAVYGGHHDQMVDMLQLSNSGREARNRAEKNRRDKLNGSIQELSTMVPHVAESPRRVDKTAVLRFSAHGLRVHYVFGQAIKKPPAAKTQLTDALMRLIDSFHITVTCKGQIVLISASVEQHLGHCQTDLYGQNITNITHPDDIAMLRSQLMPTDLDRFGNQPGDESEEAKPRTQEEEDLIDKLLKADSRSFTVRLARAGPRSEPTNYEVVRIDGCFRRSDSAPRGVRSSNFPSGLQLIRRARGRDDSIPLLNFNGNDIVLVAMARLIRPPKLNNRLMEANSFEYRTRHLIDGRIIDCDQRIGLVAGYMKSEVTGLSPFTFMHQDDVRWVIVALRQMYDCKSDYGESCYRLLTRNNRFIYLQTKGYLEIDKETNKVHSFVCINTLVSEAEGRRYVQDMKNKFSLIINTKIPLSSDNDMPASENPQQLEKAVLCLIQNLQKTGDDDDTDASTSSGHHHHHHHQPEDDTNNESNLPTNIMSPVARAASSCSIRSTKTPPLALIPPEPATVKSSIMKSVDVVAKNIRSARGMLSPQSGPISPAVSRDENSSDSTSTTGSGIQNRPSVLQRGGSAPKDEPPIKIKEEFFHSPQSRVPPLPNNNCNCYYEIGGPREDCLACQEFSNLSSSPPAADVPNRSGYRSPSSSVLKRTHSAVSSDGGLSPSESISRVDEVAKRRLIYHENAGRVCQAISNTFDQLDRSLDDVGNATTELRGQCNSFTVPNTNQQLDEIYEEHQEQKKMLVSIKSEYEAHLQSSTFIESPVDEQKFNHPSEDHFTQKNDLKPR